MDKKGIYYAFKITLTEEGPVGELLEDLEADSQAEAEDTLFKKYLKDEKDIIGRIGQPNINELYYNGHRVSGLTVKDALVPVGEYETKIRTSDGFICLYSAVFWDEYLKENSGEIYLTSLEEIWKEQIKLL